MPLRGSLVLLATLLLAGCIKVDQTLTLHADGSGTLAIAYGLPQHSLAPDRGSRPRGPAGARIDAMQRLLPLDEQHLRDRLSIELPDDVELISVSSEQIDGWRYMFVTVAFDSLSALWSSPLLQDSALLTWRDESGKRNYELVLPGVALRDRNDLLGGILRNLGPDHPLRNADGLDGLRIKHTVVVPTRIVDSNATVIDGNRAQWVFDVENDPQALRKLEQARFRVVFACDGIDLPAVDAGLASTRRIDGEDLELRVALKRPDPNIEVGQTLR